MSTFNKLVSNWVKSIQAFTKNVFYEWMA
jgi:hypothetical protein